MMILIFVLGLYTRSKEPSFTSEFNLNGLFIATMPLALAAMGQASALMVKAFDVSVGALMTVCVVVASFVLTPDQEWWSLVLGILFVIAVALFTGGVNVGLIRGLKLSSIIATLATLSILQGIALRLRPQPAGPINAEFTDFLLSSWGFMPIAFIVIVAIAVICRRLAVPQRRRSRGPRRRARRAVGRAPRRPRQLPVRPCVLHLGVRRRHRRRSSSPPRWGSATRTSASATR